MMVVGDQEESLAKFKKHQAALPSILGRQGLWWASVSPFNASLEFTGKILKSKARREESKKSNIFHHMPKQKWDREKEWQA